MRDDDDDDDEPPPQLCAEDEVAIMAWNLAGGMEWAGIPIVADILGVEDIEDLVRRMVVIRNELNKRSQT